MVSQTFFVLRFLVEKISEITIFFLPNFLAKYNFSGFKTIFCYTLLEIMSFCLINIVIMKITFRKLIVNEVYLTDEDRNDAYINARFGAVSYIPPLSFVMLISARRKSKFVNFHAKQAFIIMLIMLIGYLFSGWISWIIEAIAWTLALVGFFFAGAGKYIEIPGVIQLLSFHIIKDSPVVKKVRSAREAEISSESTSNIVKDSKSSKSIPKLFIHLK